MVLLYQREGIFFISKNERSFSVIPSNTPSRKGVNGTVVSTRGHFFYI
nr:MAG TPA: hypothetical protein [Microviridae sp.]